MYTYAYVYTYTHMYTRIQMYTYLFVAEAISCVSHAAKFYKNSIPTYACAYIHMYAYLFVAEAIFCIHHCAQVCKHEVRDHVYVGNVLCLGVWCTCHDDEDMVPRMFIRAGS